MELLALTEAHVPFSSPRDVIVEVKGERTVSAPESTETINPSASLLHETPHGTLDTQSDRALLLRIHNSANRRITCRRFHPSPTPEDRRCPSFAFAHETKIVGGTCA